MDTIHKDDLHSFFLNVASFSKSPGKTITADVLQPNHEKNAESGLAIPSTHRFNPPNLVSTIATQIKLTQLKHQHERNSPYPVSRNPTLAVRMISSQLVIRNPPSSSSPPSSSNGKSPPVLVKLNHGLCLCHTQVQAPITHPIESTPNICREVHTHTHYPSVPNLTVTQRAVDSNAPDGTHSEDQWASLDER